MRCNIWRILVAVARILRGMQLFITRFAVFCGVWAALLCVYPARAAGLPDPVQFSVAIELGDIDQAKAWLAAGLPPDFEGRTIGTGLMIGAWEGNIPMMELFRAKGADINKANAFNETALQHAAWKGRTEAVRWLVERGARIDREGREWSALHYAAFAGHADIVRYLLERGADVNALSTNGSSPLMMAAREGKDEIANRLMAAGARNDIVNDWGDNAVTWAMRHNNLKIAKAVGGADFARLAAQPPGSFGPVIRSLAVPDRADNLMAQARKFEAAGRRVEAMKLYSAALAAIKQSETQKAAAAKAAAGRQEKARAVTGLTISARRGNPDEQTAGLSYQTPAAPAETGARVGDGATPLKAATGVAGTGVPREVTAEAWLARARELEAAGRRKEAMTAYREASAFLRQR